jgi:glycosyltransferase involved in cell wall biosynthesis
MVKLTTVIPVFNGERYIETTLKCVAAQTRRPDRLIVLDNCSTDGTKQIVENFREIKAEWRQNETNIGLFGNFNRALGFAGETEYLHLLMADDLVLPTFYEKALAAMERVKGRALCYSFHETIDADGKVIGPLRRSATGPTRELQKIELLARQSELNTVLLPGVLFKSNFQAAPCQFREMPQVADLVFIAEWAARSEGLWEIPEYLCQYRWHPLNTTSKNIRSVEYWLLDEWRAMQLILPLMEEGAVAHAVRARKLLFLFAARSFDKVQIMKRSAPEYSAEIKKRAREIVPMHYWLLGRMAIYTRDFLRLISGRSSKLKESLGVE